MRKHLILQNTSETEKFTNPQGGGGRLSLPERDLESHGHHLLRQLSVAKTILEKQGTIKPFQNGIYLEMSSEEGFPLKLESIESEQSGRELVSVRVEGEKDSQITKATIFIQAEKFAAFESRVEKYLSETTRTGKPKNKDLVESISEINLASVRSLWTDSNPFPNENEVIKWEAWLRIGENEEDREKIINTFYEASRTARVQTGSKEIRFPESTVVLVQATARQLSQIFYPRNILSELRRTAEPSDFFLSLGREDEKAWVDDAVNRIQLPEQDAPAVCLLDTGVNYEHPLLRVAMAANDMASYDPDWLITDHDGHGTGMAGLSLYGDLVEILTSTLQIPLRHRIESVKILPPVGENPLEAYGEITKECVARAEIFAPFRKRVICLPVTSLLHRFRGMPSLWSASIDAISSASFEETEIPRLFFVSAGNTNQEDCVNYPDSNHSDQIHDPGQAFNVITVGAYTDKVIIDPNSPDARNTPLAPRGSLCPYSTTSIIWKDEWANKPDIVLEGGNLVSHPHTPYQTASLRLLTTNSAWQRRYLIDFGETSAATALASRMGAIILAEYPDLKAETVRGLIVHSANWTEQMLNEFSDNKRNLLRCYGYGVPSLEKALYSANNSVTLIAEDSLQPFAKEGSDIKINEMNLHEIPWAREVLLDLGSLEVEMQVTLSYFIQPNPNGKGYKNKHRYASHQLRFTTMKSDENKDEFRKRINKAARDEGEKYTSSGGDSDGWFIGPTLRHKGSIHSDIWKGTAANLATKNIIAVYPVGGWWKELKRQNKCDSSANYSLIVSIKTQETEVDIYTPILNQVENLILV